MPGGQRCVNSRNFIQWRITFPLLIPHRHDILIPMLDQRASAYACLFSLRSCKLLSLYFRSILKSTKNSKNQEITQKRAYQLTPPNVIITGIGYYQLPAPLPLLAGWHHHQHYHQSPALPPVHQLASTSTGHQH